MKVYAPFGFYGAGNTGDEATLQGLAQLVRASGHRLHVTVSSQNAEHTARVEPLFRYTQDRHNHIRQLLDAHLAQAYVFPGGTPVQDGLGDWPLDTVAWLVKHATRWGRSAVFIGVGVEHLSRPESLTKMRDRIAPHVAYWTVRSTNDRDRLLELGVAKNKITVAADMAWLLEAASPDYGQQVLSQHLDPSRPLIGVNVNAETSVMERAPRMLEILAEALDAIIDEHNAQVVFLFNEVRDGPTYDMAAAERVKSHMRRADAAFALPNTYLSPSEMMSIIGQCRLTISTRYHFCLFSALQGVPFVPLKRSDKVIDLCADLGWTYGCPTEEIDANALTSQARTLLAEPGPALTLLARNVDEMRARSHANIRGLDALKNQAKRFNRVKWLKTAVQRLFLAG
jgi:polysaccharide pyruvyl transferase WcaK-like protein